MELTTRPPLRSSYHRDQNAVAVELEWKMKATKMTKRHFCGRAAAPKSSSRVAGR